MEVKIGVADSPRELVIASSEAPAEVEAKVTEAMRDSGGLLMLTDEKGRRYVIPAARVAYVEIGPGDSRRVGFSA